MSTGHIYSFLLGLLIGVVISMPSTKPIPQAEDHHAQRADSLLAVAEDYRILADELDQENARLSLAIAELQAQLDSNTQHHDTFIPRVRNATADELRHFLDSLNAVYRGHALHPR